MSYKNNGSGAAVLEENNYYPFGLKHWGYNYTSGNPDYRYQYNGKELQDDTGMLDYGWRHYMPELGRWNGMDQLSESYSSYSPYAYVMNNPVMMYDPDGRLSQDWLMSFYNNSQNGYNTTWRNTGMGFTNNWGGSMNYEGVSTNFYFGGTSTGIGDPNGIYINVPTVELQARGNSNTWNKGMNLGINSFLMSSLFTGALGRATYDMNSSNMGSYILNSKASMKVAAFENFLFLELPASFAGEGLLVAGWRAAGINKILTKVAKGAIQYGTKGDSFLLHASKASKVEGMLDVAVHGATKTAEIGDLTVNHRVIANLISRNPEFTGQSIRLLSCNTGKLANGFAQNLSNKLGVTVYAPNNLIWAFSDGSLSIGATPFVNNGSFIKFVPGL